nr:hypothetical protein [Deltaproteobacteria bacterium]
SITSESSFGAKLEVVEVATGARQILVDEPGGTHQNFLHAALFDRAARSVYFVLRDDTIRVELGTGTRTRLATGDGFNPFVVQPSFDRERRRLAICAEHAIRVLDEAGATVLEVPIRSQMRECRGSKLSPSGRLLALYIASRGVIYNHDDAKSDTTNEVQIWDIEAGVLWETVVMSEKVHKIGLTPDDDALVVTYDYARGPVVLEIPSGREIRRLNDSAREGELAWTYDWAYSPDGTRLAIAGDQMQLLDAKTLAPALDLTRVFGRAACVTFSRDGRRLSAARAGTAVVYAV